MKKYLVIFEETNTGYSAYSPDIEGCIATGRTRQDVEKNIQEAIAFHIEGMTIEGHGIPQSRSYSKYMEVAA